MAYNFAACDLTSNQKRCMIIANGKAPKKAAFNYFITNGFNFIICADGGADNALKLGIIPNVIIGDLDSISSLALQKFGEYSIVIKIAGQNDTDVEKSIKYAIKNGYNELVLCAATGDRLDHSFGNIAVVLKYADKIKIYLHHDNSLMYAVSGQIEIKTVKGETVSIYGICEKTLFNSVGLKYPLKNSSLPFGIKESTSNVAIKNNISIRVSDGYGLIVRDFNLVKKYGLVFDS